MRRDANKKEQLRDLGNTTPPSSKSEWDDISLESSADKRGKAMTRTYPKMQEDLSFHNTMGRSSERFEPLQEGHASVYCCGPTVYNYQHIGNMRAYVFEDLLIRTLRRSGLDVQHVMNITDVGHLVSDADDGEDKMLIAARREKKTSMEIADYYTNVFFTDCEKLNITRPDVVCKATDHIAEMIDVIQSLEEKGYTYESGGNVYFSIDKCPDYGKLSGVCLEHQDAGARVAVDSHKRNPLDFVLWFTRSKFDGQELQWESPWGKGYPGWHIECSSMALRYLGKKVDIHCGGIDHIGVHHSNEIAQSEAYTQDKWVNFWLHSAFLVDTEGKMSKSKGEFLTLSRLEEKGFTPAEFRYLCLGSHYRSELAFSWESLSHAQNALKRIQRTVAELKAEAGELPGVDHSLSENGEAYLAEFNKKMASDLNTPQAIASVRAMLNDTDLSARDRLHLMLDFDEVLGLGVESWLTISLEVPQQVVELADRRDAARASKSWDEADKLREEIAALGFVVEDSPEGRKILKK